MATTFTRRAFIYQAGFASLAVPLLATVGCRNQQFLSPLRVSATTIQPNGSGLNDESDIDFTLTQRAEVSATLLGPDGKQYVIRAPQMRAPDDYQIRFTGVVPVEGKDWLRVVPDGTYNLKITAKSETGQQIVRQTPIIVKNADTTAPEITDVFVQYTTFSPNGDGFEDTTKVSYKLSKKATVRVYATDSTGGFYLISPPQKIDASAQAFEWDGTAGGGKVLPDGKYSVHIEATDDAGNFTDYVTSITIEGGGIPRAEIRDVRFSPIAVPINGILNVTVVVRNTGTVPIKTLGPVSGTKYTTEQSYATFTDKSGVPIYYERAGVWRVAVGWQNEPQPYPLRWGFWTDGMNADGTFTRALQPNEEVTVTGQIVLGQNMKILNAQRFFAALEQGGAGFPTGQVGQTNVTISY